MQARRPQSFYLRTFGCQMNEHDSERIAGVLEGLGLQAVRQAAEADLLVYNTCSIREKADTRLAGHLGEAHRLKRGDPGRLVVVAGCLAQSRREAFFAEFPFVDVLVGPQSLHELPLLLDERLEGGAQVGAFQAATSRWSAELPRSRREGPLAWVQIMTGCTNFCSYCIVPYVRGPEASRPPDAVEAEVRELVAGGVREVTLLGQNVNAYGLEPGPAGACGPGLDLAGASDSGPGPAEGGGGRIPVASPQREDFPALLARLSGVPGLARIRFMTSHPKDVSGRLIRAMAELTPVCEHLHLPVQSGSDRVLRAMRRGYGRADYLGLVAALRQAVPDLALTTDVIVGFPGETDAEFEQTLSLVEEVGFDAAFTFIYSPRGQTDAAGLPDRVPRDVAEARMGRLVELVQRSARVRNQALVGGTVEVLVEGRSRQDPGELCGRTRTFKTVNFGGSAASTASVAEPIDPRTGAKVGDLVPVRVVSATSTSLRGEMVTPAVTGARPPAVAGSGRSPAVAGSKPPLGAATRPGAAVRP